ncbi:hypothetical protein EDB85DRAFT_1894494 [Lactarius pseudohatsudake]|nr:hypothetical protein EDB85DRAFT_1894494 [Lactarius pseudohatsudake]
MKFNIRNNMITCTKMHMREPEGPHRQFHSYYFHLLLLWTACSTFKVFKGLLGNTVQKSITNTPHHNLHTQVPYQTSTTKWAQIIGVRQSCNVLHLIILACGDPGCNHSTHNFPLLDPYSGDNDMDDHVETEEDQMGDEPIPKLTQGSPFKSLEVVAREQPTWKGLYYIAESILADQSSGTHIGNKSGSASASGHVVSIGTTPVCVLLPELELKEATAGPELSDLFILVAFLMADTEAVAAMLPGAIQVNQTTTQESSGAPWPTDTEPQGQVKLN